MNSETHPIRADFVRSDKFPILKPARNDFRPRQKTEGGGGSEQKVMLFEK